MVQAAFAFASLALATLATAHGPGEAPVNYKRNNHVARDALEQRCGPELARTRQKRALQRAETILKKRGLSENLVKRNMVEVAKRQSADNSTANACIWTPETTQGPYHVLGEIVRQNITEGEAGVPLEVNIDFIDISTCQPVQVWVDAWHANATGFYSAYVASSSGSTSGTGGMGGGSGGGGQNMTGGGDMASMSGAGAAPSGGGGGGIATGGTTGDNSDLSPTAGADTSSSTGSTDDATTFLRGVWQTGTDGHLTMYSIVPGWYTGRTQHFHVKAYAADAGYVAENGTFVAETTAVHTGQIFFDNSTLDAVAAVEPYASNSIAWADRTTNEADSWYYYASSNSYDADFEVAWVDESDITAGIISSIQIGLNMSYSSVESMAVGASFNVTEYVEEGLVTTGAAYSVASQTATGSFVTSVSTRAASAASSSSTTTRTVTGTGSSSSSTSTTTSSAGMSLFESFVSAVTLPVALISSLLVL